VPYSPENKKLRMIKQSLQKEGEGYVLSIKVERNILIIKIFTACRNRNDQLRTKVSLSKHTGSESGLEQIPRKGFRNRAS